MAHEYYTKKIKKLNPSHINICKIHSRVHNLIIYITSKIIKMRITYYIKK